MPDISYFTFGTATGGILNPSIVARMAPAELMTYFEWNSKNNVGWIKSHDSKTQSPLSFLIKDKTQKRPALLSPLGIVCITL